MAKKYFGRKVRNLIAAFRGLPPEESRSFLKRAKPVGETISAILKKISITIVRPENVIQENWESIVGNNFAFRCQPVKILNNDVLIVHSTNAVIRSELQMLKPEILKNIHKLPRCTKISDVRFVANR